MSISNTVRKAGPFTGDGVNASFPFTFKVFQASDVLVVATDLAGIETVLTLTSQYTVSLNTNQDTTPGGTVTLLVPPAAGYLTTLGSQVAQTQPTVLTNTGGFFPTVINDMMDRVTILAQQLQEQVSRSFKVPISSSAPITPDGYLSVLSAAVSTAQSSATSASGSATSASGSAAAAAVSAATLPILTGNATAPLQAVPLQQLGGYRKIQDNDVVALSGLASLDVGSIPGWAKRVRICITGCGMTAAGRLSLQLGMSSGLKTNFYSSIYRSYRGDGTSQSSTMTDSCVFGTIYQAASLFYGEIILTRMQGDSWLISSTGSVGTNWVQTAGSLDSAANSGTQIAHGAVALTGPLTQFRIKSYDSALNFNSGAATVFIEG
jgi:hypothetical protein